MSSVRSSPAFINENVTNNPNINDINRVRVETPILQPQIIQTGSSNDEYDIGEAFDDYSRNKSTPIKIYALVHVLAYILFNLIIVILQIALIIQPQNSKKIGASTFNSYSGFWV
jgi:hypothetical protein